MLIINYLQRGCVYVFATKRLRFGNESFIFLPLKINGLLTLWNVTFIFAIYKVNDLMTQGGYIAS